MALQERDKARKERDLVTESCNRRIEEAEKILAALGYKEGDELPQPKKTYNQGFTLRIKERIVSTLTDKYPNGVRYTGLFEHVNLNWPELPRVANSSLSPQLTRLKDRGVIGFNVERGVWFLAKEQTD
jgi:hypothetical protein